METYVTVKGQILIPASLRKKYGIKSGTKIIVTDAGDAIVLKPVTEQYLKNLQGSLKGKGGLKVLVEERSQDKERDVHEHLRSLRGKYKDKGLMKALMAEKKRETDS